MQQPIDFYSALGKWVDTPRSTGSTTIPVLPFLIGKSWDDVALAYIHALRPSSLRVSTGEVTTDSQMWRVTVIVEKDVIVRITQEVVVGLDAGFAHGAHLQTALEFGLGSEKEKQWRPNSNRT